jgi:hypothetical protein
MGASFHTGPLTCGISSWVQFPLDRDVFSAYNKMSFDGYFSFGRIKGFLGFPVMYTLNKKDYLNVNGIKIPADTILGRVALGDLHAYIGMHIGSIEPRIGIVVPLGYGTNSGVWLGSKNIVLKPGAGFSGDLNKRLRLRYGGEFYFSYYIAGYPEIKGAQGKRGSWSIEPDFKVTWEPCKKWKVGIETFGGFKKLYPIWLKYGLFQGYELTTSAVPHLIGSYDLSSRIYLTGKAGIGPSFKKIFDSPALDNQWYHSGYAINIGIGAGFYP